MELPQFEGELPCAQIRPVELDAQRAQLFAHAEVNVIPVAPGSRLRPVEPGLSIRRERRLVAFAKNIRVVEACVGRAWLPV